MPNWFLRKNDGLIYGPASLEELHEWAADGRIAPDDDLSEDQVAWLPAPSVPELDMHYEILLEDGARYGPIHILALRDLLLDGSLTSDARIWDCETKTEKCAGDWLIPLLLSGAIPTPQPVEQEELAEETPQAPSEPVEEPQPESDDAESGISANNTQRWKELYETERSHRLEIEENLTRQNQELRDQLHEAQSTRDRAHQKATQLQDQLEELRAKIEDTPGQENAAHDIALRDAYTKLNRNYDALLQQLQEKNAELNEMREKRFGGGGETSSRIRALEEQLEEEREQAAKTSKRIRQIEADHMELVKTFRDLNDRYIRLRQKYVDTPTAPSSTDKNDA